MIEYSVDGVLSNRMAYTETKLRADTLFNENNALKEKVNTLSEALR